MPKEPRNPGTGKQRGEWTTSNNPFLKQQAEHDCEFAGSTFLGQTIDRVLKRGDAIIIGTTRDGGAVCVTMCEGDQRHKTYCHTQVELDNALAFIHDYYSED